MRKCLVVCYSRTGCTAKVGRAIAMLRGADFELVRDQHSRVGWLGFLRSVRDTLLLRESEIIAPGTDPGDYATIILGSPVWGGRVSAPMRTYILRHRGRFQQVGLFCTMAGSGGERVLDEMEALCRKPAVARLAVPDGEIFNGRFAERLAAMQEKQAARAV